MHSEPTERTKRILADSKRIFMAEGWSAGDGNYSAENHPAIELDVKCSFESMDGIDKVIRTKRTQKKYRLLMREALTSQTDG